MEDKKIIYTVTVRTSSDGVRAAAVVRNIQFQDGSRESQLTTAFAQEDLDTLIAILDGRKSISTAIGGDVNGNRT